MYSGFRVSFCCCVRIPDRIVGCPIAGLVKLSYGQQIKSASAPGYKLPLFGYKPKYCAALADLEIRQVHVDIFDLLNLTHNNK
ncbi:hypothetical protein KSF78_0005538 [Schistosoma japonicum]|nr:hypothetical protein KSF78_0005538 [Schistosoma japonicum]